MFHVTLEVVGDSPVICPVVPLLRRHESNAGVNVKGEVNVLVMTGGPLNQLGDGYGVMASVIYQMLRMLGLKRPYGHRGVNDGSRDPVRISGTLQVPPFVSH
jgi:hypothetical protein